MLRPGLFIVVAADDNERGQGRKIVENPGRADVAAMDDVVATHQEGSRFGAEQAVGIGDDSHAQFAFSVHERTAFTGVDLTLG